MTGLLLKDILVLRKSAKLYLLIMLFYLVLSAAGFFDNSMVTGFVTLFTMMLPISSFSYDELARWDKFAATLPTGRRGIVGAKYLLVLFLGILAELLALSSCLILSMIKGGSPAEDLFSGLLCVAVGVLMNSAVLPVLFKYGAEKGRIINMTMFAVLFLAGLGGAKLLSGRGSLSVPVQNLFLPIVLTAAALLALFASYHISLGIYRRKEL